MGSLCRVIPLDHASKSHDMLWVRAIEPAHFHEESQTSQRVQKISYNQQLQNTLNLPIKQTGFPGQHVSYNQSLNDLIQWNFLIPRNSVI